MNNYKMHLFCIVLLMLACNASAQQQNAIKPIMETTNNILTYWYTGRPETREELHAMRDVFKRYGGTATRMANCALTDSSSAVINGHNEKVFGLIKKNYGFTQEQVMQQVDSLHQYYSKIAKILAKSKIYQALEKEAIGKGKSLDFKLIKQPPSTNPPVVQLYIFYFDYEEKYDKKDALGALVIADGKVFELISPQ